EGCQLFDGSGLSRRNKTSPMQQLNLLKYIAQQPFGGVFYSTLSIAGVDGTLGRRMRGTAAESNVHAKTGTHANVSALSGYTRTRDGERIAFSFQWNGNNVGMYKYLENLLAIQLSEFSYTSGTAQLPVIR
ncbi:MAG: D-alanyl-D-alanine carboxypeptidase, partial [Candidatus Kapabacteria bacterium]|nr:D-alanyl-D-alanine carboxypeptidase [Candidatus Kapabacteria bacterium]